MISDNMIGNLSVSYNYALNHGRACVGTLVYLSHAREAAGGADHEQQRVLLETGQPLIGGEGVSQRVRGR